MSPLLLLDNPWSLIADGYLFSPTKNTDHLNRASHLRALNLTHPGRRPHVNRPPRTHERGQVPA
jgi:hypothetical protein